MIETIERVNIHTTDLSDKKRIDYIDIARGIAIILMVIGHCCKGFDRRIIFSFHMPLFIIVSGMFFKEDRKFKDTIIKLFKKLIIPYCISIFFVHILRSFIYNESFNIILVLEKIVLGYTDLSIDYTVSALWFIPFFIMCQIIFYIINKISKNDDLLKCIICLLCTFVGFFLGQKRIYLPCSFDVALASVIFYYIGYIFKKYNLIDIILNNKKMLIYIFLLYCMGMLFDCVEIAMRIYPLGITSYITAIAGTIVVLKISKLIENFPKFMPNILKWFGRNSIYALCFHYIEWKLINYNNLGLTQNILIVPIKLIIITTCMLLFINLKNLIKKLN